MALSGLRVVEFAGLAPGPFAGLVLADNGASVIRVDKPTSISVDVLSRGKRSIAINPKMPSGLGALKKLISSADVLIDPFRPGVMERLGLGPNVFLGENGLNKRLIYARMSGFPRTGPYKDMAGHDINYLALSGVLSMLPGYEKPNFPLNLLADFAGGGLMCVLGILLALVERGVSGRGQVVNADMVSGARYVSSFPLIHVLFPYSHLFGNVRGHNILDGGAPYYDLYVCKDGGWMSVGCLEPQFFKAFIDRLLEVLPKGFGLDDGWRPNVASQEDREQWPKLRAFIEKAFLTDTRDYWARAFYGTDACALPVLTPTEARESEPPESGAFPPAHPRILGSKPAIANASSGDGVILPPGADTEEILNELGLSHEEKTRLAEEGALVDSPRSVSQPKL